MISYSPIDFFTGGHFSKDRQLTPRNSITMHAPTTVIIFLAHRVTTPRKASTVSLPLVRRSLL
jgi:hypothetical protein